MFQILVSIWLFAASGKSIGHSTVMATCGSPTPSPVGARVPYRFRLLVWNQPEYGKECWFKNYPLGELPDGRYGIEVSRAGKHSTRIRFTLKDGVIVP